MSITNTVLKIDLKNRLTEKIYFYNQVQYLTLLTLNNCLKTMNKSFVLFVIKPWSQIQNLTIVIAERGFFFKFKQNVRVWQNPKFLWRLSHSDVCLLWRLSLWRLSSLTFVTLTFVTLKFVTLTFVTLTFVTLTFVSLTFVLVPILVLTQHFPFWMVPSFNKQQKFKLLR